MFPLERKDELLTADLRVTIWNEYRHERSNPFRDDIEERKLVTPYSRVVETGYGYYALYPARDEARAKVRDFANWLQSVCQPDL